MPPIRNTTPYVIATKTLYYLHLCNVSETVTTYAVSPRNMTREGLEGEKLGTFFYRNNFYIFLLPGFTTSNPSKV